MGNAVKDYEGKDKKSECDEGQQWKLFEELKKKTCFT